MASWKAKKGNPFERKIAYSLMMGGYKVERLDDNTKGIDLIASKNDESYAIECKHHAGFTWNKLVAIFNKTLKTGGKHLPEAIPVLVFKGNNQPALQMMKHGDMEGHAVWTFTHGFGCPELAVPKGFKVWKTS